MLGSKRKLFFFVWLSWILLASFPPVGVSLENHDQRVANSISFTPEGVVQLGPWESVLKEIIDGQYVVTSNRGKVVLTLEAEVQEKAEKILKQTTVPWGAIVALDPKTGRVLTLAGHSEQEPGSRSVATRAGFPAASLFKIVTASAAIEQVGMGCGEEIKFRGGNYVLSQRNYKPSDKADNRSMSLQSALAKSVNPVFGRIALKDLSRGTLETYATNFGFGVQIPFEVNLEQSYFEMADDDYAIARTGAGFGNVRLSPLHAALLTATVANKGKMMRPFLVERIVNSDGQLEYQAKLSYLKECILPSTATELLQAMTETITDGTAKKQFMGLKKTKYGDITIAGKTGTLKGDNPQGLYTWFVATAPVENPRVAIAALVIDPGNARIKGIELGRRFLEAYFNSNAWE